MGKEEILSLLNYEPTTGEFRWKAGKRSGKVAGYPHPNGYVQIWIKGKPYYAHRLAWVCVHGVQPAHHIDHIDGNKTNNAILNLRDVCHAENMRNQHRPRSNGTSMFLGVSPRNGKWRAAIKSNGKSTYLGTYSSPEDAHAAYMNARRELESAK